MGILIDTKNEEDKKVYEDVRKDLESIIHNSEDFSYAKSPQKTSQSEINFSKYNYKTTKELSKETELSSRKINAVLIEKKLMNKQDDDWFATKKGKKFGGIEKEGQYGQFVVWPEKIKKKIQP